ncbi:MAG: hypothetical protein RLZ76_220 [Bacteroidota bacterium]
MKIPSEDPGHRKIHGLISPRPNINHLLCVIQSITYYEKYVDRSHSPDSCVHCFSIIYVDFQFKYRETKIPCGKNGERL